MMIQIFDVQDKKVVPSIACHKIPELKVIMDIFPDEYLKVYQYIFGMTCPDGSNWYVNLPEHEKEEVIDRDISPYTFYKEDMKIEEAMEKCRKLYETPTRRAWMGAKKMVDKVAQYLDETEITEGKDSNAMAIDRFMSKLVEYSETYSKLENILKEEQAKVRGDVKVPYWQKNDYKEKEDNIE